MPRLALLAFLLFAVPGAVRAEAPDLRALTAAARSLRPTSSM